MLPPVCKAQRPHRHRSHPPTTRSANARLRPNAHSVFPERQLPHVQYVDLKPGTDTDAYVTALDAELKPLGVGATSTKYSNGSDTVTVLDSLTALLTLMPGCAAGLGVLGGVVLDTHERVHDLGIHKTLGMTPRQTVTTVVTSVVLLGLAGVAVAVLGSLRPAGWAARIRTATALRAEWTRNPLATLCVVGWVTGPARPGDPHPASWGRLTWTRTPRASNSPPRRPTCCANCTHSTAR